MVLANDFDTGQASGTTITTGNSAAAGDDAFDSLVGSPKYSNAQAHSGSLSMLCSTSASSQAVWSTSLGAGLTTVYGRVYLYQPSNLTGAQRYFQFDGNSLSDTVRIVLTSTGKLEVNINGGTNVVMTNSIALAAWVRVEWSAVVSGTTWTATVSLYNSPESTTATETITQSGTITGQTSIGGIRIGTSSAPNSAPFFDDFAASSVGPIGPLGGGPQTQTAGLASTTAVALGPTLVPVVTLLTGFGANTAASFGPALVPAAALLPAGASAHSAAASGPTLVPGAATLLAGDAVSGPGTYPGSGTYPGGGTYPGVGAGAVAYGPAFASVVTITAGFCAHPPTAFGATPALSGAHIQAGLASHPAIADGPTLIPAVVVITAGFAAHPAAPNGPLLVPAPITFQAGTASHAAAALAPSITPVAVTIRSGFAPGAHSASGPAIHALAMIPTGIARSAPTVFGLLGLSEPVIVYEGFASVASGRVKASAAASTVSVDADETRVLVSVGPE